MVFVDSNVILDVITADPIWQTWSEEQLSRWLDRAPALINPIVYAEIAFACEAIETVDDLLPAHLYAYRPIPREAAFLDARAQGLIKSQAELSPRLGSRQPKSSNKPLMSWARASSPWVMDQKPPRRRAFIAKLRSVAITCTPLRSP